MSTENRNIWAFARVPDSVVKQIYEGTKNGKSRFGWGDSGNLREHWDGELAFLLRIKPDDWIVHVNLPSYGRCVAVAVTGEYNFDEGIQCVFENDPPCNNFNHYIPVDAKTLIEFDRSDPNVLSTVNLKPRARYQQVRAKDDFFKTLQNLKGDRVKLKKGESREVFHLRDKANPLLAKITKQIQETHRGKKLESLLAEVIRNIPGVVKVHENGSPGWGTDNGADLIVTLQSVLGELELNQTIVVQVNSFDGPHHDLSSVDQIVTAIKHFKADAGMLITTGESTEQLEKKIEDEAVKLGKAIGLIAGKDVARFIIDNNSSLLFG